MEILNQNLDNEFEISGKWSDNFNDIEKDGSFGKLLYRNGNIELELFDSSHTINSQLEVLYGINSSGICITIMKPFVINEKKSYFSTLVFVSDQMIIGKDFITTDKFNMLNFTTEEYNEWIYKSPIESQDDFVKLSKEKYEKNYITIKKEKIKINDYIKGETFYKKEKVSIATEKCFSIKPEKSIDLEDLLHYAYSFKNLTGILMKRPVNFKWIEIYNDETRNNKFRYFFSQNKVKNSEFKIKGVSYKDIESNLDIILNNWFEKKEELEVIEQVLIHNETLSTYLNTKLIDAIKVLEVHHRNFLEIDEKNSVEDSSITKDRKKLREFIKDNVENVEYYLGKINHIDQKTNLNKRIKDLFKSLPSNIKVHYIKQKNKNTSKSVDSFAYKLAQTRNSYIHADNPEKYPDAFRTDEEIMKVLSKLKEIVWFLCLREIEVPEDVISNVLFPKQYEYQSIPKDIITGLTRK